MYYCLIYFIIGTILGSFFFVAGSRGPIGEKYLWNKSRCDICKKELKWYELIPLFSFLFQKGKCNSCKQPIDRTHFIVELCSGILFTTGYYLYLNTPHLLMYFILISVMLLIFISDFKYMIILDSTLVVGSTLYIIVLLIFFGFNTALVHILSGLGLFITLLAFKKLGDIIFKKESMGGGDIKLAFFMGLVLNYQLGLVALILSTFLALPYALAITYFNKKNELPYGPFLIAACVLVFVFIDKFSAVLEVFNIF